MEITMADDKRSRCPAPASEPRIGQRCTTSSAALAADRHSVEVELRKLLDQAKPGNSSRLHETMCYAVLGGGKRTRPILAVRVARFLRAETAQTIRLAAAV